MFRHERGSDVKKAMEMIGIQVKVNRLHADTCDKSSTIVSNEESGWVVLLVHAIRGRS
jgi:hypothetical protein